MGNKKFIHALSLIIVLIISSCIPNKKVLYVQDPNYDIDHQFPTDSVIKSFDQVAHEYLLKSGDIISIEVVSLSPDEYNTFNRPNLKDSDPLLSGYIVDDNGNVKIPIIGDVKLAGLTISDAELLISKEISNYLVSPIVSVKLLSFKLTILGEVNRPGTYTTYNEKNTIFDLIGLAGDLTDFADRDQIRLLRSVNGQTRVVYLNLLNDNFLNSDFYYLLPNDILIVPALKVKNFRKYQVQNYGILLSTLTVISLLLIRQR